MSEKTKKSSDLPVATSISDNDSLVMISEQGQTQQVKASTLNGYIGAPKLFKFSVEAGEKMVFKLESFEYHSFTISGSTGAGQASGFVTGYDRDSTRWFFNAKRKGTDVKAYVSKTEGGTFVIENGVSARLNVRFVSSAKITAEPYNEATHGELAELTWQ